MAHPVDRALEDRHLAAEAERDHGRVVPDDAAADHDHLAGADARDATEQEPAAAERLLEEVRAGLRGEAACDLAHRREQGQLSLLGLDGLVGDCTDAARDQGVGERTVRREVEVGEQDEPLAQVPILGGDRLLDLQQELGLAPDLVDGRGARADGLVRRVRERAALPGRRARGSPRGRGGSARARRPA